MSTFDAMPKAPEPDMNQPISFLETGPNRAERCAVIHESENGLEILHVYGEADLTAVGEFETALESAAASGRPVVIDLGPCQYLDSTMLSAFVKANQTYLGRFWIVVPQTGIVRRLFTITSLIVHLPIVDSLAAAGLHAL